MITLARDRLTVHAPHAHEEASFSISFQRTVRIPDDGEAYPLPAGLGAFPVRHVDDLGDRAPAAWRERGGVVIPMYSSEAMWINFQAGFLSDRHYQYRFAVKIAAGKINAVSGMAWQNGLNHEPQDYVVVPEQPWLDGFNTRQGEIRQFVAEPLGAGETVEEQLTGRAEHGGMQIAACPMRRDVFDRRFPEGKRASGERFQVDSCTSSIVRCSKPDMGLGAGGRIEQKIYDDRYGIDSWEQSGLSRCFVHLCDARSWRSITGEPPPHHPLTKAEYKRLGIPWFTYYDEDLAAVKPSPRLAKVRPVKSSAKKHFEAASGPAGQRAEPTLRVDSP